MGIRVAEQSRAQKRARRRVRSWGVFIVVAGLLFVLLYALAETVNRGLLVPAGGVTPPPLVPARVVADRHDWLENGMLAAAGTDGEMPLGWQRFDVAQNAADIGRQDSYLRLDCGTGPCISGIMQRRQGLPIGHFTLEADVYLGGRYTGLTARLGFDGSGGRDARAASVQWSPPGGTYGWQRLSLDVDHAGGAATVFVVFDVLVPEGEGRIAGLRLLGPAEQAATVAVAQAAESATPTPVLTVEERVLLVAVDDLQWQSAAELRTMVERAKEAGFTTVYLQVRRYGYAYYDSAVEPAAPAIAEGARARWDPLAEAVAVAHQAGLRLYAWVDTLPVWQGTERPAPSTPAHMLSLFGDRFGAEWLQATVAADPAAVLYASPAHPQVRTYLASVCRDLVTRYDVDGIYLTGLAYVESPAGTTMPTVEATVVVTVAPTADADTRREQLAGLLQAIVAAVREAKPATAISVAVSAERETGAACRHCDDGSAWAAAGLTDFLVPRSADDASAAGAQAIPTVAAAWVADSGGAVVVPVVAAEVRSFVGISRAIEQVRQAGAGGVAVASYGDLAARDYWDDLAQGPFAGP
ncbi:MAG: family 10 glycosylhydrolase [Anaerolineae bacterium]